MAIPTLPSAPRLTPLLTTSRLLLTLYNHSTDAERALDLYNGPEHLEIDAAAIPISPEIWEWRLNYVCKLLPQYANGYEEVAGYMLWLRNETPDINQDSAPDSSAEGKHTAEVHSGKEMVRGAFAGMIMLQQVHTIPSIGYIIEPSLWGHGIATEAVRELVRYVKMEMRIPKVLAMTAPGHRPSQRVLEKIGFVALGPMEDPFNYMDERGEGKGEIMDVFTDKKDGEILVLERSRV